MTNCLIAILDTDNAARPRYESGRIVASADVRAVLCSLFRVHFVHGNARMQVEAEIAAWQLGQWRGEGTRFCGHIVRYDLYPTVEPHASERLWSGLARGHDLAASYRQALEYMAGIGIEAGDPDYLGVAKWLAGHDSFQMRSAAQDLAAFRALALREDVASCLTAYRPWQWALATAQDGGKPAMVERELLAEIAQRQAGARP
ncbi:MAG TPA: hypothetical protein VFQ44_01715 [Streptosporangiaceae bacterium]|nr:hypothetical protein [Streptosporangiaceae bacterium]